jgi:uncharacterized protein (TIGR02265 family)
MRDGFSPYDFNEAFDLDFILQRLPPKATQRGMFLNGILDEAIKQGKPFPGEKRYTAFKEYTVAEGYRLSVEVAKHLYPGLPVKESFRRLGHTIYPTLLSSMIGRTLFGFLGRKVDAVMRLVPKGYAISSKEVEVELTECADHLALFRFYSFPDFDLSFDIGTLEGIVLFCKKTPQCFTKRNSASEAEILVSWT